MNEQLPSPDAQAAVARPRRTRIAALSVAATVLLTAGAGVGAWASTSAGARTATTTALDGTWPGSSGSAGRDFTGPDDQQGFGGGRGADAGTASGSTTVDSSAADDQQIVGVVTIDTELGYQDSAAAGTGIVLTAGGRILTNDHVIAGATSIEVTDETTGRTYTADVVGTNATEDVAVLQLRGASGLTPATIATDEAALGDEVTAVGNANGTGTLTAAEGTVTGLDEQITTQSEGSAAGETLDGLIETDADVVSGDSGGPLKDADGAVVGIDTAASSGAADITGYAIPIRTALAVAAQIVNGEDTAETVLGLPAFLGVSLSSQQTEGGALVAGALDGTPAASAGLAAGDVITAIDGTDVGSAEALTEAIAQHEPGDRITIAWTDAAGDPQTATVTLIEGPAA